MTDLPPVTAYLCGAIDRAAENIPSIAADIEKGAELLVSSLLNDKKILVCGSGLASPLAQLLTTGLMDQHEFERPGLPALNISNDAVTISSIASAGHGEEIFSKQVRAIGMEGDCLVLCALGNENSQLMKAVAEAHSKEIKTLIINGSKERVLDTQNTGQHQEINLKAVSLSNGTELSVFTINTLIRCIESKLFGTSI